MLLNPRFLEAPAFSCALAIVVATSGAFAAPAARPIAPEIREDYDAARAAFARGEYARCVEALERAQRISPDPRLLWNSAACEKKLGHYAKAIRYVERYLVAGASTLSEEERKDAAQFLEASRAYVAQVTIAANVESVQIFVDGDLVGTTPLDKPIWIDEGEHVVRYTRSGYTTVEEKTRGVAGANLRWAVELVPVGLANPPGGAATDGVHAAADPPPRPLPLGPILLGGAGVVALGAGGFFSLRALSEATAIEDECGTACPPGRWERYRDEQIIGNVVAGVGAALVVGAVVWWLVTPRAGPPTNRAARLPRGLAF